MTAGEDESKEMKADVGSGATSKNGLTKTQSIIFPQKVTSPK